MTKEDKEQKTSMLYLFAWEIEKFWKAVEPEFAMHANRTRGFMGQWWTSTPEFLKQSKRYNRFDRARRGIERAQKLVSAPWLTNLKTKVALQRIDTLIGTYKGMLPPDLLVKHMHPLHPAFSSFGREISLRNIPEIIDNAAGRPANEQTMTIFEFEPLRNVDMSARTQAVVARPHRTLTRQ